MPKPESVTGLYVVEMAKEDVVASNVGDVRLRGHIIQRAVGISMIAELKACAAPTAQKPCANTRLIFKRLSNDETSRRDSADLKGSGEPAHGGHGRAGRRPKAEHGKIVEGQGHWLCAR